MWRGVPLCNYANEALSTDPAKVDFTNAPVKYLDSINLGSFINDVLRPAAFADIPIRLTGPAIEVMAVDSPWMSWMIYGQATPPKSGLITGKPSRSDIAYGSVATVQHSFCKISNLV